MQSYKKKQIQEIESRLDFNSKVTDISGPTQLTGDVSLVPSVEESPENRARELEAMMMLKVLLCFIGWHFTFIQEKKKQLEDQY